MSRPVPLTYVAGYVRLIHQPREGVGADEEGQEDAQSHTELIARYIAEQRAKDDRHARDEQQHDAKVARHLAFAPLFFTPRARPRASSPINMLSRPATIRNVLPYS